MDTIGEAENTYVFEPYIDGRTAPGTLEPLVLFYEAPIIEDGDTMEEKSCEAYLQDGFIYLCKALLSFYEKEENPSARAEVSGLLSAYNSGSYASSPLIAWRHLVIHLEPLIGGSLRLS